MCYENCTYEDRSGECSIPYGTPYPCREFKCKKCSVEIYIDELIDNCCPHCGTDYGP